MPWSTMNRWFSNKYVGSKEKMCWTLPLWLVTAYLHVQLWINIEYVEGSSLTQISLQINSCGMKLRYEKKNCPPCWSNTKGWPVGCHDYAEQLHWPFVFDHARSRCGCCCGNDLYVRKIVLWFKFTGVKILRQKTKNSWQGVNLPGVIRKWGLSFPGVMWNSYTASSKRTFFELWHK